ncbi:MAG: M3 family peptidase, partial [Dermabacter sp.]|nr:M3 family peptidase [Dermabacter sp.]
MSEEATATSNPLLEASSLPYNLPDFAAIRDEHYLPAIEQGIREAREAYASIANDTSEPTFENVVAVLDQPSRTLNRAATVFYNIASADGTEPLLEIESKVSELLTELDNELHLNPQIFERLNTVYETREEAGLDAEQVRLTEKFHQRFTLAGAALSEEQREELAKLNLEISKAQTEFSQQVTRDMNAAALHLTSEEELAGLSEDSKAAAARAAKEAGREGWLLTFILPTNQPALSSLTNRDVRKRLYEASVERGDRTWQMAAEIAALRARKAAMLGFEDFASLAVADRTARTAAAVDELF